MIVPAPNAGSSEVAFRRITAAKKILGPQSNAALIESAVWAFLAIETRLAHRAFFWTAPKSKREKAAIDRVARALRRLRVAVRDPNLLRVISKELQIDLLDEQISRFEMLGQRRLGKPRRSSRLKQEAADLAASLLTAHRVPLSTTPKSKFVRLAAVIYGDPRMNLFHQCRHSSKVNWHRS